jgi:streptogramin lyase
MDAPRAARQPVTAVTEHRTGLDPASGPYGIVAGPDGALWCTLVHADAIARVDVEGSTTTFPLGPGLGRPSSIAVGPDGALWVALEIGALARLVPIGPPEGAG